MMERVALYARVSTARQEQEKTVQSQIEAIDRACTATGVVIPLERRYVDEGFSGSRLDRPALDALRDAAADGLLDQIYLYCPDPDGSPHFRLSSRFDGSADREITLKTGPSWPS